MDGVNDLPDHNSFFHLKKWHLSYSVSLVKNPVVEEIFLSGELQIELKILKHTHIFT